jgi:hypothetical protein
MATLKKLAVLLAGLAAVCHLQSAGIEAFSTRTILGQQHQLSSANPHQYTDVCGRSSSSLAAPPKNNYNNDKFVLQGFLDNMFGGGGDSEKDELTKILSTYDIKDVTSKDVDERFESLSDYITNRWLGLFESGNIKLTTPVKVSKTIESGNEDDDSTVDEVQGCRLVFKKMDTGYKSKKEESTNGGGGGGENKSSSSSKDPSKKRKGSGQGGVEVLVQKISSNGSPSLRVIARRCEVDEDTMIKEMSEDIIVTELRKAIDVWKKVRV